MNRAVVLLSGGLDSATTLGIARAEGLECYALSFAYGQRHYAEVEAARRVARSLGAAEHRVAEIDLRIFGRSALTDDIDVPKNRIPGHSERSAAESRSPAVKPNADNTRSLGCARDDGTAIPITYVPARNTIFLSYALAWAEVLDAHDIFIGVNAVDYSGYPDCRPGFIQQFEKLAALATRAGAAGERFRIRTPLISMTKAEIVKRGAELRVDFSLTHSCYDPDDDGVACGECDSCLLRLKGFEEAALTDLIRYRKR